MKHGKKYVDSAKKIEGAKLYDPAEAVALAVESKTAKFDETVEVHVRLGVDSRHADQQVRGAVVLPNGTGKKVRVLVFAKGDAAKAAEEAGAEYVGAEEYVAKIQNEGFMDFDVVIATPDMMGVIGRLGKFLGPRGLMPSPKAGTVTPLITSIFLPSRFLYACCLQGISATRPSSHSRKMGSFLSNESVFVTVTKSPSPETASFISLPAVSRSSPVC